MTVRPARFRVLLIFAVVIAIVAAGLDVAQWLRAAPFWADEEMIALNLRDRAFTDLAGPLWLGQSAPLAWLLLQRLVILVFGTADVTLRFVPLLFGIATTGVAVWVGRRFLAPASAALLVLLCAFGKWLSFFRFEMKHYSSDAFWALLLPALAAWVLENRDDRDAQQRWTTWWVVAAVAQFFSNGGLLVAPMCAVIVALILLRNRGTRSAIRFALTGLVWAFAFAVNYQVSLQHTHHSRFLRGYWAEALPVQGSSIVERAAWLAHRVDDLAINPGGASLEAGFWICALSGFAFSRKRAVALLFASVPLTACLLAAVGLVPLRDRLALWTVPALYVGIALLFDTATGWTVRAWQMRRWTTATLAAAAACASLWVGADVLAQGRPVLEFSARHSNHGLDDRTAAKWLMERRLPGDAVVTTHLGWPALWWYGGISLGQPTPRGQLPDGSVMYEAVHERARSDCAELTAEALSGRRRVLVHVGFPDMPEGFFDLLLRQLEPFGSSVEFGEFANFSRTALITLHQRPAGEPTLVPAAPGRPAPELTGCVTFRAARRW
jgi:hypothetical protein